MKPILILTVFCLVLLGLDQVNGQCYDLIQQYYQCKHLKMVKQTPLLFASILPTKYKPDSRISENELTDKFYRKLNSNDMNFDKAMKLFRKIYTETNNCKSEFCECASLGIIDYSANYSLYFRNEAVFPHVKNIIEAFNKKFEPKLLPFKELKYEYEFYPLSGQNLSSLIQFCINHDYSKNRLSYYKNNFTCESSAINILTEYDCFWEVTVENKKVTWYGNFSNSQLAKALMCKLKKVTGPIEEKRFCALTLWANRYPDFVWKKDVTSHIDSIIEAAKTFKPKLEFIYTDMNTYSYLNMISVKSTNLVGNQSSKFVNDEKLVELCLDSKTLRIDCEWSLTSDGRLLWDWANFTYKFDESTSRTIRVKMSNYKESPFELDKSISNETLIKDKFGENWIHIKSKDVLFSSFYYMYDLNGNISLAFSTNYITMFFPKNLLDDAEGLLVNGFPELEMDLRKRKRRSIEEVQINEDLMSCQAVCERSNQSPINDIDSLVASKVEFNKCLNDCIEPNMN